MAYRSKLYKQLSCRDFGADCDFMVRAKTAEEVIEHGYAHSCKVHSKCESSHETDERRFFNENNYQEKQRKSNEKFTRTNDFDRI